MGAYVSIPQCAAHYGVTPNCSILPIPDDNNNTTPTTPLALGDVTRGNFQPDPDIAGIGVLGAFVAVTLLSLVLSVCGTVWWLSKYVLRCKSRLTPEEKQKKRGPVSISGILEHLVLSCSDQQVFTGGAYAITLRYAKGCSISAYHYNIVANMLLLTCATHLMAATICRSRRYWEHRLVGVLRIIVTSLVYLVTGILLSNQGSGSDGFPTEVPPADATYSPMLLPAACFQSDASHFTTTVQQSFEGTAGGGLLGGGQISGWVQYLVMLLFYAFAVAVGIGRLLMRAGTRHGRIGKKVGQRAMRSDGLKRSWYCLFGLYLVAGNGIAAWTVGKSAWYIIRLRSWVDGSGWLQLSGSGKNPENDPSSFGQLVPMLLMSFTVFTFLQDISDRMKKKAKEHHDKHHDPGHEEGEPRGDDGTWVQITNSTPGIGGHDHDGTTPSEGGDKKLGVAVTVTEKNDAAPDETPRNGEHNMDNTNAARLNITPVNYSRGPSRSPSQSNISSSSSSSNNGSASSRPQVQAQTRLLPATYALVPKTSMSPIVNGGNSTPPPPPVPSKSSSRESRLTASNTNTASSSSLRQGDGDEHDGNVVGLGLGLDFGTQDDKRSARGVLLSKKSSRHLRG